MGLRVPDMTRRDPGRPDRQVRGGPRGSVPVDGQRRAEPRRGLPARLLRLRRLAASFSPGGRHGCCGWTRSPPTSTARGATRTCWYGTGRPGPSTTGRPCTSITPGPPVGQTRPGSRPSRSTPPNTSCGMSRDDLAPLHHELAAIPGLRSTTTRSTRSPTSGWSPPTPCPTPEAVRAAYRLSLLARLDNPSAWLPREIPA